MVSTAAIAELRVAWHGFEVRLLMPFTVMRVAFSSDTFRAGAIEQLRTHTKALNIPLYARGYDRDAASVAQDAIAQARRDGLNVVLVDTAGRMQHNEPLMRALAKLITLNRPDLVLFVGGTCDASLLLTQFARKQHPHSSLLCCHPLSHQQRPSWATMPWTRCPSSTVPCRT